MSAATKLVDRLTVVADAAEPSALLDGLLDQLKLAGVQVLLLVHEDVIVLVEAQPVDDGQPDHVVEVDAIVARILAAFEQAQGVRDEVVALDVGQLQSELVDEEVHLVRGRGKRVFAERDALGERATLLPLAPLVADDGGGEALDAARIELQATVRVDHGAVAVRVQRAHGDPAWGACRKLVGDGLVEGHKDRGHPGRDEVHGLQDRRRLSAAGTRLDDSVPLAASDVLEDGPLIGAPVLAHVRDSG